MNQTFRKAIKYVQSQWFGPAMVSLSRGNPDDFEAIVHKTKRHATNPEQTRLADELHIVINLRFSIGPDELLWVEGRLENADLPTDTKHPIILPGRHQLTRFVVLSVHANAGHAGPAYTLIETRQKFWITHGVLSVKHYIGDCVNCALRKAKLVRQLMADLTACRLTAYNKPFKFCGLDYLRPL